MGRNGPEGVSRMQQSFATRLLSLSLPPLPPLVAPSPVHPISSCLSASAEPSTCGLWAPVSEICTFAAIGYPVTATASGWARRYCSCIHTAVRTFWRLAEKGGPTSQTASFGCSQSLWRLGLSGFGVPHNPVKKDNPPFQIRQLAEALHATF